MRLKSTIFRFLFYSESNSIWVNRSLSGCRANRVRFIQIMTTKRIMKSFINTDSSLPVHKKKKKCLIFFRNWFFIENVWLPRPKVFQKFFRLFIDYVTGFCDWESISNERAAIRMVLTFKRSFNRTNNQQSRHMALQCEILKSLKLNEEFFHSALRSIHLKLRKKFGN